MMLKLGRDFVLGAAIFAGGVALWDVSVSPASGLAPAGPMALAEAHAGLSLDAWTREVWTTHFAPMAQSRLTLLILLGTTFASAIAFNLALVRHLRSAYVHPRRRRPR
jgi:hypothetical protein